MTTLTRIARAKINLTLDIGTRRPDGYHSLRSVMQAIALHDTLTVTHTPHVPGLRLQITGPEAKGIPADKTNLVYRAAAEMQILADRRGICPHAKSGLAIQLEKRIPAQAGLGGGSSDAAAALCAVRELLGLPLSQHELGAAGAALGADVSFFLSGGTALAEGVGELISPLPSFPPWPLLVVKPPVGVSTGAAYAALDALPGRVMGTATERWLRGERTLGNDFEAVILPERLEIADVYRRLSLVSQTAENGESFRPLLCGSGAALFCRFGSIQAAEEAAARLSEENTGKVWVTETVGKE